jgi:molybdopterin biosynthesis enzyme MoaB
VAIPGSPAAVELAATLLVDMLPHGVDIATGHQRQHAHKK